MDFRNADKQYRDVNVERVGAGSRQRAAEYDEGLRGYMLRVYNLMAIALVITGSVAFMSSQSMQLMQLIYGTPLQWVVMFAPLGIVFYLSSRLHRMTTTQAQGWFWAFSGVMGLSLSYIFLAYTGQSVAKVFFITSAAFGGLSLYGYTTRRDLTGMGTFLVMGLIGILIASVVNLFLHSPATQFAISILAVLIFAGLSAYDTQRIKGMYYQFGANNSIAVMGALALYLDFINLFVQLLQLLGNRR